MTKCKSGYTQVQMTVKGKQRTVHLEEALNKNGTRARTYVKGKTVSGNVLVNKSGAKRFVPFGVNAGLLG